MKQRWAEHHDPYKIFSAHEAKHQTGKGFCGYYLHSRRLAKFGTDYIYDQGKKDFQSKCSENKINWEQCKEIMFSFKKTLDQKYRNMLWHMRERGCEKCEYWDNVYKKHTAHVECSSDSQDITDEEMLSVCADMDGADQASA